MIRRVAFLIMLFCTTLAPATAAQWNVDYSKSRLGFSVLWSGQPFEARFKSWKASIIFDPADLTHAKATVTIDLGSETSAAPDNDDGLKGAEGFAISQFPSAHFDATGFESKGGGNYLANGKLSLHGVTRPHTFEVHVDQGRIRARTSVRQTEFGITPYSQAMGSLRVGDVVQVTLDVAQP